ncbi:AI-2E family transporter [Mycobacterium sp.]|uniref:AI-2E family transporter n=1 Tax=Mycobacterium sp. TaxID=1785 RepID=UPI002C9EC625|nr:AI-2E family transporter [Mycobacterium sp.]HME47415.1 AI-2E family transporter [Mycobacterium sp.]
MAETDRKTELDGEGPIADAERVAWKLSSDDQPLGPPGPPLDRRSPFFVGMSAAAGVAVTYAVVRGLVLVSSMLLLIGVAFFVSLGLEPAVSWLINRRFPRWAAVTVVLVASFGVIAAALAAAVPPLFEQARQFIDHAPHYVQQIQNHSSLVGRLNDRFHLQQRITDTVNSSGGNAVSEVVKAGKTVFGTLTDLVIGAVLTVYFVANLPNIRATLYRFVPNSRRPRAILIGDRIFAKVGAYMIGNIVISVIAGVATFIWLIIFGVPYPLLLGIFVALLDLIPFGSTVAGIIVAAVALTVSVPVSIATLGFYIAFRLAEDYLLVPKIIGKAVEVPAVVTLVAVLVGGALLGIIGALVAIPIAAAIQLLVQEVLFPRLDQV